MSGHSKWATIKRKKAKEDAKRGKAFTKLVKEITVCARDGGGEPNYNPRLRLLLEKAKHINMPQENIVRAIKKGTGELPGQAYEALSYEGYGPNGIAVIIECLTDNKNRMAADARRLFSAANGTLGETGSVNWMFEKMGIIQANNTGINEDDLLEKLIDYEISNITCDDEWCTVHCEPKALDKVKQALEKNNMTIESAQIGWVPKTPMALPDEQADKAYDFLSTLDDHDDVQNVYTNLS